MTPPERASLRAALVITLALYAALFAAVEIWNPLGASRRAETMARPGESGVVTLHLQLSASSPLARAPAAPVQGLGAPPGEPAPIRGTGLAAESGAAVGGLAVGTEPPETAHEAPRTAPPAAAQHPPLLPAGAAPPRDAGIALEPSRNRAGRSETQHVAEPGGASAAGGEAILGGVAGDDTGSGQAQPGGSSTAAAAGGGAAAPTSGGRDPAAVLAVIRARIEEARVYPAAARSSDIEGSVRLLAEISADGRLAGSRVLDSSGSAILDHAGLSLLRSVFPVSNPLGYAFNLEVTIAYRLNGGSSE